MNAWWFEKMWFIYFKCSKLLINPI
jgi:hypothetical protein